MELDEGTVAPIITALRFKPKGLTITEIARKTSINRNSVAKYLQILMVSGQVEMQTVGNAKVYSLSHRVPLSSVLSCASDFIVVIDGNRKIVDINDPYLRYAGRVKADILWNILDDVHLPILDLPEIAPLIADGLDGIERTREIELESGEGRVFSG